MPHIGDAFPSKYLKASDLDGQTPIVVMTVVKFEGVGQSKQVKPVLYFKGKEKGLVLNKTNGTMIAKIVGSPLTENWKGHKIKLIPTETEFQGETVDCIRVKAPDGAVKAAPPITARTKSAPKVIEPEPDDPIDTSVDEAIPVDEQDFDPDEEDSVPF